MFLIIMKLGLRARSKTREYGHLHKYVPGNLIVYRTVARTVKNYIKVNNAPLLLWYAPEVGRYVFFLRYKEVMFYMK